MKRVLDQSPPKRVKNIQKFLGLANYYWQLIKNFVSIARLLPNLVKKVQKQDWMEKQKKVFKGIKEIFTKKPVSAALDLDKKVKMEVDASDYTTEGVLSMECEYRQQEPAAYLLKSLNKTERNYKIHGLRSGQTTKIATRIKNTL